MKKMLYLVLFIAAAGILFSEDGEVPDVYSFTEFNVSEYLSGVGEQDADSNRLNTLGFYAYQDGDLYTAAKYWRCALDRDDSNGWAHYNLACALSLFAEGFGRDPSTVIYELEYGIPEVDNLFAYVEQIFDHLKQAVFYNGEILSRMAEDTDLNLIRGMKEYRYILMYPDNDPGQLLEIVDTWYGASYGAFPGGSVHFDGGTVFVETIVFDDNFEPEMLVESGRFVQEGLSLTLYIDDPEPRQAFGELVVKYDDLGFIQYFYLTIDGTTYSSTPDFSA